MLFDESNVPIVIPFSNPKDSGLIDILQTVLLLLVGVTSLKKYGILGKAKLPLRISVPLAPDLESLPAIFFLMLSTSVSSPYLVLKVLFNPNCYLGLSVLGVNKQVVPLEAPLNCTCVVPVGKSADRSDINR